MQQRPRLAGQSLQIPDNKISFHDRQNIPAKARRNASPILAPQMPRIRGGPRVVQRLAVCLAGYETNCAAVAAFDRGDGITWSAEEEDMTFYVQLIRGTDERTPPSPEARLVGPELGRRLHVFKWKNYWEISRRTVVLKPGAKSRQRLTPQRELEISLTSPKK